MRLHVVPSGHVRDLSWCPSSRRHSLRADKSDNVQDMGEQMLGTFLKERDLESKINVYAPCRESDGSSKIRVATELRARPGARLL